MMSKSEQATAEVLESLSKAQLMQLVLDYCKKDSNLLNEINIRFKKPEFSAELEKMQYAIDQALDGISDYHARDRWGYATVNVSHIQSEIRLRAQQGHIKLAFIQIELLYRRLLKLFEYQEECEISEEAEYCLKIMEEIADLAILDEDKAFIFEKCLELVDLDDGKDYGGEYEDGLFHIAVKVVTNQNRAELEQALTQFTIGYREETFQLIWLDIIKKLDTQQEYEAFIAQNLDFPKIRELAFNKAMASEDFEEAIRLCTDNPPISRGYNPICPWLYRLYEVYEKSGNQSKLAETAQKILLEGDLLYYDKLKTLLKAQAKWEASYESLLEVCKDNLEDVKYMKILSKENEHCLLMEQVKQNPTTIYQYGKELAPKYRVDVQELFVARISEQATLAANRKMYQEVCQKLRQFIEAGYEDEATELINVFRSTYSRRPAFIDELGKVKLK